MAAFWFWMSTHVSVSCFPLFSIVLTEVALGSGAAASLAVRRARKAPAPSSLMARAKGAPATLGEKAHRPAGDGEARSRPLRLCTPGGARESLHARAPSCQPTASQPRARDPQDQAGGRLAA